LQRSSQKASPPASGARKKYARYSRVTDPTGSLVHGAEAALLAGAAITPIAETANVTAHAHRTKRLMIAPPLAVVLLYTV
jgi:hypothetical protein